MSSLRESLVSDFLFQASGLQMQECPSGALYVVGLPIGNLGDITLRALWILSKVDAIAAEDTRETKKILEKYGISAKLLSVREHNEHVGAEQIINFLAQGWRVAMVTDAGTPSISDPGAKVVKMVVEAGYRAIPIPGCSAVITALSAAGLEGNAFTFVGFLPSQTKARHAALKKWLERPEAFVLYEAPHRIADLLLDLAQQINPTRPVVIAREITKKFEEFTYLTGETMPQWLSTMTPKGEYAILIGAEQREAIGLELTEEQKAWLMNLLPLVPTSKLAAIAAKVTGIARSDVYEWLLTQKES